LPFVFIGCGPAIPADTAEPGSAAVAGAGDRPVSTYTGPAHKFEPRAHRSHARPSSPPPPDLGALPALELRLKRCYGVSYRDRDKDRIPDSEDQCPTEPEVYNGIEDDDGCPDHSRVVIESSKIEIPVGEAEKAKDLKRAREAGVAAEDKPTEPTMGTAGEYWRGELGYYKQPATDPAPQPAAPSTPDDYAADGDAPRAHAEAAESFAEPVEIAGAEQDLTIAEEEELPEYEDWGSQIYLSNDDTMSLSSAQRVIYAIDHFLPLPLEHIRPHELLNYFSFETQTVGAGDDFSVLADIAPDPRQEGIYTLGMSVRGRPVDKQSRRNAVVTLVVDRSGSMEDEGRMDYLKRGLKRMVSELKTGDMVHMVLFDHNVCVPMENYVVGRDRPADLARAIDALEPRGSTDVHRGLARGYQIADGTYQPEYNNRVILITDALANTGVTDERMISMISKFYDKRRIRLSGVGVGREFNDALLDRLTERGKGAYVFLGSEAEVDAVFGPRFISLLETTALDVHFLLHLPESLRMNVFYGEESSTVKEDVQAIHYFANTSQLFMSDLMARGGALRPEDDVMLTIEYQDPETGEELFEEYAWNLGEIEAEAYNIGKGRFVMAWVDMLAQMAARPLPPSYGYDKGSWADAEGWQACDDGRRELERLAGGIEKDLEVRRIFDLWDKYCSRYDRPRNPVKRQFVQPEDSWPGALPPPER
jgi:Ca-activated chloride channel family protein